MIKPVEIVVGRGGEFDPAPGTTDCPLPLFAGQSLWVEKTGYGTYDYSKYQELSGGGFRLLGAGNVFVANERFYVHFTGLSYGTDETGYTNGFNRALVQAALFGRVGWNELEPGGDDVPAVSGVNVISKGGRYFQDFHSLVTLDNIYSVMKEVGADGNNFNAHLESMHRGVLWRAVSGIFKGRFASEYLSQKVLFRRNIQPNDVPVTNKGQFVYVSLRLPTKPDLAVQVDQVALYFNSDVTFNMYLFHDARKEPLAVFEVSAIADTQTLVTLPDVVLNHIGPQTLGGTFYLGYFQDDLGDAKAYYESYSELACDSYGWNFGEANRIAGQYNFDRRNVRFNNVNYGMNFHISTFRDHTQQIVKNAALFDDVIGLTMAAQIIERVVYTTRSNGTERILNEAVDQVGAQLDLNGAAPMENTPYIPSLKKRISEEYKQLQLSFFPKPKSMTVNNVNYDC